MLIEKVPCVSLTLDLMNVQVLQTIFIYLDLKTGASPVQPIPKAKLILCKTQTAEDYILKKIKLEHYNIQLQNLSSATSPQALQQLPNSIPSSILPLHQRDGVQGREEEPFERFSVPRSKIQRRDLGLLPRWDRHQ